MSPLNLALAFLFLLTILNYWVQRSVLYPPFIFCAMWLLDLAVCRSGLIDLDPIHAKTLAIVAAGAAFFSGGGLLASLTPKSLLRIRIVAYRFIRQQPKYRSGWGSRICLAIVLCGLPLFFYQVLQISKSGTGTNMLMKAREAQVAAAESGATVHSVVLDNYVMIAILVSLLFATEGSGGEFWIVTAFAFVGCILSTGRTNLLQLLAALSAIRLLQAKRESLLRALSLLRWPVALFISLYILLIFTNKNTEGLPGGITGIATYFVLIYIAGPLAAFDLVVERPAEFALGTNHTFEFPLKVASALHLTQYIAPPKLDSYVMLPFPTNVYTVFKFYFLELGVSGTLILMLFLGLLHSLLYLKARQGSRFSIYLFAFSVYAVLMVIFDDHYYEIGAYVRAIGFGLIYYALQAMPFRLFPEKEAYSAVSEFAGDER